MFVRNNETGFVVEPEPRAIAERLTYLADHPAEAARMGRQGCAAVRHIRWDTIVTAMLPDEVLHGSRSMDPPHPAGPGTAPLLVAEGCHAEAAYNGHTHRHVTNGFAPADTADGYSHARPATDHTRPAAANGHMDGHITDAKARAHAANGRSPLHTMSASAARGEPEARAESAYKVCVLDMQPIDPPVGGGRMRLLGLYHGLGENLPTTYIGTYDWPGEKYRHHRLSETLEEISVPLGDDHFAACARWQERAGGKGVTDVSFDLLAHHSPAFGAAVKEGVREADIVVFAHPWVYPLVRDELAQRSYLIVYDSQNVEGVLRATLLDNGAFGTELVKHVLSVEHELCHRADLILACSHEDRDLFHRLYGVPYSKTLVVPNGTFTRSATPPSAGTRDTARRTLGLDTGPIAVFLGSAYQPNVDAATFVCTTLAPALPHVTFAVCGDVGTALPPAMVTPNVRVTGRITDDEKALYFAAADVAINPMFAGSGTNVKMFDFMAAGLAIVSTPIGARGIVQGSERAFHVCASQDFAAAIARVVHDHAYAHALGAAARRLAEKKYSWERISQQLGARLHRSRQVSGARRPFFSVVVATYERRDHLQELVSCLHTQTLKDFEVIIIDQSAAPWQECTRHAPMDMLYIHTDVQGAVAARNTGAFHAHGEVIAFTDDDCRPLPTWLENARPYFDDGGVVGIEGLILSDKRDDPRFRAVTNMGFEGLGFMTANLFLRRETFMAIDGFDDRFDHPHFREDTDLGWRASEHGSIPFGHDVCVYHPPHRRDIAREGLAERNHFFEKDALLLAKHPERYRPLFLSEGHYRHTPGFREHFLRGAEKYGVAIDDYYTSLLTSEASGEGVRIDGGLIKPNRRPHMERTLDDNLDRDDILDRVCDSVAAVLQAYRPIDPGSQLCPADAFFAYRLLLGRHPDKAAELPHLASTSQTYREFLTSLLTSQEFYQTGGFLPPHAVLMAEVEGFRFWFDTSDREMGVRMALGLFEPKVVQVLKRLLRPGMTCIDAGAQTGFYTCLMASHVGQTGTVYAFEALPASYDMLARNVRENNFGARVRPCQKAVSAAAASIDGSLVSGMWVAGRVAGAPAARVESVRIEDMVGEHVDLIKIDVEGHEPAAIEGMRSLLRRDRPIIISEVNEYWLRTCAHSSAEDYVALLRSLDYDLFNVDDILTPLVSGSPAEGTPEAMDIVAFPRGYSVDHGYSSDARPGIVAGATGSHVETVR
jgi:FkbM family methyltransferase